LLLKIRSKKHLQYISQKPCLICGRTDVQSAHIRYAGAGIGQKPCDIFTTPLCLEHHREQHTMNEKMFWQLYQINPIAKAMGFALESPDKKIRQRVYEHFKEENFKRFFEL
jgi:hypothetical protein